MIIIYSKIFVCLFIIAHAKSSFAPCPCLPVEQCPYTRDLTAREQRVFMERHQCEREHPGTTKTYVGFSSVAKGDPVLCCPRTNQPDIESPPEKPRIERKVNRTSIINVRNLPEAHRRIRQAETNGSNPFFLKKPVTTPKTVTVTTPAASNGTSLEDRPTEQCKVLTSIPPKPESGCCGRDTSDVDRITDLASLLPTPAPLVTSKWDQYFLPKSTEQTTRKITGSTKNKTDVVDLEPEIAGGNDTQLEQYPWTVLLVILFDYRTNPPKEFNCGGSLISADYVLTAAHCVQEKNAVLASVEVHLAEYDKRTFPNDCIAVGEGRKCVQNIIITARDVTVHPSYEETWLHNDIALIRLREPAPYTNVIRPICLAQLNIDTPKLANLPLAVAGWGQNRQFYTNVKQSTVLNLVPKEQCERFYPNISKDHLCAAGPTGEDTCRGDSGGPLMGLYRGRYYVMGVVSGKRADSPCGSGVPSLFTNVFNYVDWIQGVIRGKN